MRKMYRAQKCTNKITVHEFAQHDGEQESRRRKGAKEALLSHEGVSPALQRSADLGVSCEL